MLVEATPNQQPQLTNMVPVYWYFWKMEPGFIPHEHQCKSCGEEYVHYHPKGDQDHEQFDYQCPYPDCEMFIRKGHSTRRPTIAYPWGMTELPEMTFAEYIGGYGLYGFASPDFSGLASRLAGGTHLVSQPWSVIVDNARKLSEGRFKDVPITSIPIGGCTWLCKHTYKLSNGALQYVKSSYLQKD